MSVIASVTIFACGDKKEEGVRDNTEYTLTFMYKDTVYDTYKGVAGSEVKRKPDPTIAGASFDGWSLEQDGEIVEVPTVMPNGNFTYHAVFTRTFNITFDAAGGTVSGASSGRLSVKSGASVGEAVSGVSAAPPDTECAFDGWYYNGAKVDSTLVMPEKNITLVARYTVGYTIKVMTQRTFGQDGFDEQTDKTVTGRGFLGATVSDLGIPEIEGYTFNSQLSLNGDLAGGIVLRQNGNEYSAYLTIIPCYLNWHVNAPEGIDDSNIKEYRSSFGYNSSATAVEQSGTIYTFDGYRFAYWSKYPSGKDEQGNKSKYYIGDTVDEHIKADIDLYAIWEKGYENALVGSSDLVFLHENSDGSVSAILQRRNLDELIGEYDAATDIFTIKDGAAVALRGKISGEMFMYLDAVATTRRYVLHSYGQMMAGDAVDYKGSINSEVTLDLADDGTATYKNGADTVAGAYAYSEDDSSYKFTPSATGNAFNFRLSQYKDSATGADTLVFEIRNDAVRGAWYELGVDGEIDPYYVMILDGYGMAVMYAYGLNSSLTGMTASSLGGRYWSESKVDGKDELSVVFASSSAVDSFRCILANEEHTVGEQTVNKIYKRRAYAGTTIYAFSTTAPDDATSDKIVLDGYGNATVTASGVSSAATYVYDEKTGIMTVKAGTANPVEYFIYTETISETDYTMYKPAYAGRGDYNLSGVVSGGTAGTHYIFRVYDDGNAALMIRMIMSNSVYGNVYLDWMTVVSGTYTATEKDGEYLFNSSEPVSVSLVNQVYTYFATYFNTQVIISYAGDFKFEFGEDKTAAATALGTQYAGITLTYDGVDYVTDGYGKAVAATEGGASRNYTAGENNGVTFVTLSWTEKDAEDKDVSKSETYFLIDGAYRRVLNNYVVYNATPFFAMYVTEGDYAVLRYSVSSTSVAFFETGRIEWLDSEKKFGTLKETVNTSDSVNPYWIRYGGGFKFGFDTVTVQSQNVNVIKIYDGASFDADNKSVITLATGEVLTIDRAAFTAEYKKPTGGESFTTVSGEFGEYGDILTISYSDNGQSASVALRLTRDASGNVTSFVEVGAEAGYWALNTDMTYYMYMSGVADSNGKYVASFGRFESGTFVEETSATYARSQSASLGEYILTFADETEKKVMIGYAQNNNFAIYAEYKEELSNVYAYASVSAQSPSYILGGGGYNYYYTIRTSSSTINCTREKLDVELDLPATFTTKEVYKFTATSGSVYYFVKLGDGTNELWVRLDTLFMLGENGSVELEKPLVINTSATASVTYTRISFTGLGIATLYTASNSGASVQYAAYGSGGYYALTSGNNLITLFVINKHEVEGSDTPTYTVLTMDTEVVHTYKGAGYASFTADGFGTGIYVDSFGVAHTGTYTRLESDPDVVLFTYRSNGVSYSMYLLLVGNNDTKTYTFTVIKEGDDRYPSGGETA